MLGSGRLCSKSITKRVLVVVVVHCRVPCEQDDMGFQCSRNPPTPPPPHPHTHTLPAVSKLSISCRAKLYNTAKILNITHHKMIMRAETSSIVQATWKASKATSYFILNEACPQRNVAWQK